jgi:glucose/arabinose dehydrogenase
VAQKRTRLWLWYSALSIFIALAALGAVLLYLAPVNFTGSTAETPSALPVSSLTVPEGFHIELYASNISGARSLAVSPAGIVFVGSREAGNVYAVRDTDNDFHADKVFVIASGLQQPNGVAFQNGSLYVAEISRIIRIPEIETHTGLPPLPKVVYDKLPTDEHHGWKFIAFGPDGKLYVPIGAPCNNCVREDPYASIARMNADGSGFEIYARGVRNTVGFAWDANQTLWFTDNGRDWFGDDQPADELNHAPNKDMHFGYPYCHAGIQDDEFTTRRCDEFSAPEHVLGAHVAALGMRFYNGTQFPEKYRNGVFIAEHGSWNRKKPVGYRVVFVRFENNRPVSEEVFASGWLADGEAWGRPVDVAVLADGSLLISDDKANAVYRVTYG